MKTYQVQFSQKYFFNVNATNKEEAEAIASYQMDDWIENGSGADPEIDQCVEIPFVDQPDFTEENNG